MTNELKSAPYYEASSGATPATDTISIADIIESYDNWGVPHFQRGSVWGADNISALLESLYYDTPCGSIILWTPKDIDAHGVPLVTGNACTHLIIDGQQRTRSVYAAFKGLFDITQAAIAADDGRQSELATDGAARHWAINLNEVAEFDGLLHRPEKRLWPLFAAVPDPHQTEERRRQREKQRQDEGKARYNIPESPFKYNFVPLRDFTNGNFESLLKQGRLFIKRQNGNSDWTTGDEIVPVLARLEELRFKVQQMGTRRLFRKVLTEKVTLDGALRVFIRINSGGRPVQMEEKGFSMLVGSAPSTSEWVKTIFARVHGHHIPSQAVDERDRAMQRMNERSFGFKLFIRVFMLTTCYHTGRAIGAQSLSFAALRDRRFLAMLEGDAATYEQLWRATADVVVAMRRVLEGRLGLDALQFLPETTSLFPLFLCLIKFPGLMEDTGTSLVRVRPEFEAGIAGLALSLLLKDLTKQKVMSWSNDVVNTHDDAATLLERLGGAMRLDESSLRDLLRSANSLTNRYTLLLYGLQRSRKARDFNYVVNKLTGKDFDQVERQLARACDPEKQHIVPYSHLVDAYGLEPASRAGSSPINNIGNMTYISHAQNSLGGLSDTLVDLAKEDAGNALAHFVGASLEAYEDAKRFIEAGNDLHAGTLKGLYERWIELRQSEIAEGFVGWAGDLQQEWTGLCAQRQGQRRIEPAPPILGTGDLAHRIRTLGVPDAVEDALLKMFATDGWLAVSGGDGPEAGSQLTFSLRRKRRTVVRDVVVSSHRLTAPHGPDGVPATIEFGDVGPACEMLARLSGYFQNCQTPVSKKGAMGAGAVRKDGTRSRPQKTTLPQLLAEIRKSGGDAVRTAEALLASANEPGAHVRFGDASASMRVQNVSTKRRCTLFVLTQEATFYIGFLSKWQENAGVGPDGASAYEAELTEILGENPRIAAVALAQVELHMDRILLVVRKWAVLLRTGKPAAPEAAV